MRRIENMTTMRTMRRMRMILSYDNWPINDDVRIIENNRGKYPIKNL